jgi:hypothetical protein
VAGEDHLDERRGFGERLKSDVFHSIVDLQAAINTLSGSTTKSGSSSFGQQTEANY